MFVQEVPGVPRGVRITSVAEDLRSLRESRNHKPVPAGEDLVVQMWPGTSRADLEQLRGRLLADRRVLSLIKDVAAGELSVGILNDVATRLHAEAPAEHRCVLFA